MSEYYEAAAEDPTRADLWDKCDPLPDPGEDKLLDSFLDRKGLSRADLARIGTRIVSHAGKSSLVWLFPDGFKYRHLFDGKRASEPGVTWKRHKIVRPPRDVKGVVVAEGETDGAQLAKLLPDYAIAIMPAGALNVTDEMRTELRDFEEVYLALDNDIAGNEGAAKYGLGRRLAPPEGYKDWCEWAVGVGAVAGDLDPSSVAAQGIRTVFSLREVLSADLGTMDSNHWFADGIVPVNGLVLIHGKKKSLKSVILLELLRAISTGTPFAGYLPFIRKDGAGRTLIVQMEIPPFDFQQRLRAFADMLAPGERELFLDNFFTAGIADGQRPRAKVQAKGFLDDIRRDAEVCNASVIAFDPIQRMTGAANVSQSHEMDVILDAFDQLQRDGYTVVACHHNNKASGKAEKDADAMTGTQRFSGDPDAVCSVWYDDRVMIDDDNPQRKKQRNFSWTLRNGAAAGRSITVQPSAAAPELLAVSFDQPITAATGDGDEPEF